MDLLQLRYFQTVARLEHMTHAAQELHIPQPALSKTISNLEKKLGYSLFDRRKKNIYLNEYGKIFLESVDKILAELDNVQCKLNDLSKKKSGDVKLAIFAASNLIPDILSSFHKLHPNINFSLIQHNSNLIIENDFDLCISTSQDKLDDNYTVIPLIKEEIFLSVPLTHTLAKRNSIKLIEIENDNFISLKKGKELRNITDDFCNSSGFSPNIIFESDDPSIVRELIKSGQGVAFIPEVSWGGTIGDSMKLLHIDEPACNRTISLIIKNNQYTPQAVSLFRDFIIEYFSKFR